MIWLPSGYISTNDQGESIVTASPDSDPAGLEERIVTLGDYDYSTDQFEITSIQTFAHIFVFIYKYMHSNSHLNLPTF